MDNLETVDLTVMSILMTLRLWTLITTDDLMN